MKRVGLLCIALPFTLSCAGEVVGSGARPIVDGTTSADGAHPSTVYLWLGGGSCSGTLVSPRVVLSAEHCLSGTAIGELAAFFGNDADGEGTWIEATHRQVHPQGDVAMMTLAEPGPAPPTPISAVPLDSSHIGTPVLLVGFGDTGGSGGAGVKREGATTIEDLGGDIMYVGGSGSKTCYGDSGGPTFIDWDGVRHVAGVSSFITDSNCNYGQSGNVRTDVYHDWFMAYIAEHDPASCAGDGQCASGCSEPDPDCPCAGDGLCTAACADLTADPDCAGCAAGDQCRADCPALDTDCCGADGSCNPACASSPVADPDCSPPDDGGDGDGDGDGDGADDTDVSGGCSAGTGATTPAPLLIALVLLRRRRQPGARP